MASFNEKDRIMKSISTTRILVMTSIVLWASLPIVFDQFGWLLFSFEQIFVLFAALIILVMSLMVLVGYEEGVKKGFKLGEK